MTEYLEGRPTAELTRQFGLAKGTVLKILSEHSVPMRRQGLVDEHVPEAIQLYESGWSLAKIANRFDVSVNAVYHKLLAAGARMRDPHGRVR